MLVLASSSPRRQDLLRLAGIPFHVRVQPVDETRLRDEPPEHLVQRLARAKATAIAVEAGEIVLGADTTVAIEEHVLEKPANQADARRMLELLSGREHTVLTGICLRAGEREIVDLASSRVRFTRIDEDELTAYLSSHEWADKAGGYAVQGLTSKFIESIAYDPYCVMGLPVALVYRHLKTLMMGGAISPQEQRA